MFKVFANFIYCGHIVLSPISDADVTASALTMSKEVTKGHLLVAPAVRSFLQQDVLIDLYIYADSIIAPTF